MNARYVNSWKGVHNRSLAVVKRVFISHLTPSQLTTDVISEKLLPLHPQNIYLFEM